MQTGVVDKLALGNSVSRNRKLYVEARGDWIPGVGMDLGTDFFSLTDVEFDMADNVIRLIQPSGCTGPQLVYWNKPYSQVAMAGDSLSEPAIQLTVMLNGHPIEAVIDTASAVTVVAPGVATAVGGVPLAKDGQTVVIESYGPGKLIASQAKFASVGIGDEVIKNTKLQVAEIFHNIHIAATSTRLGYHVSDTAPRVIIGADFVKAHRMLLSRENQMIYFSYTGGPVFDLTTPPKASNALSDEGKANLPLQSPGNRQ